MLEAIDLVDDGGHLQLIVSHRAIHADGGVKPADVGDLRRVEIFYAFARRPVDEIIGRMLVGPRGAAAFRPDHFKDGVVLMASCGYTGTQWPNSLRPRGSFDGSIIFSETLPLEYRLTLSSNTIMLPGPPLHETLVGSNRVRS